MKLQEALLCIDCETVYAIGSNRCPQCGSQVAYPLSRALDRPPVAAVRVVQPPRRASTPSLDTSSAGN